MPLHCTIRENRSERRFWTAKKVGQVACKAMADGATRAEIDAAINLCGERARDRPGDEAEQALAVAEQALLGSNTLFDADAAFLERFLALTAPGLITAIALRLVARIPYFGPVLSVAIPVLREVATARVGQITVRRAANADAIAIIRRAAANAARFRQTGT